MVYTLIAVALGMVVTIPISKIEIPSNRYVIYWLVALVGFVMVTGIMIVWAESIGENPVGAPGGSGWMFVLGLGFMAWKRRKRGT